MGSASNNPNESNVTKLLSMGFSRAHVIQALEECGSFEGALNSLLTGSGSGSALGSNRDIDWDSVDDPPLKLADSDDNKKVSLPSTLIENLHSHATKSTVGAPSQPMPTVGAGCSRRAN